MNTRTPEDERFGVLMRAAQAGDAEAYTRLLTELTPRIRQVVGRRGGRSADVEDVVQNVLLSIHVARASYDPGRPFFPWLLAIVRNRLADGARRRTRVNAREVQVEDLDVTFSRAAANMNIGREVENGQALWQAMASLPPGQRSAIELLKLRGLSLKEAAAQTGASVGALKVASHRAIAALRRKLTTGDSHGH